ncbi:MAG: shikimate kinase [Deferribacterales bacterium]|nr:shikimate kinase [Deferribacterales bacterium]
MNKDIIFLTGFMGCGKSASGRELALILNRPFIDTDKLIEKNCNMSIPEIFEKKGESFFRQTESALLEDIKLKAPCVVSTGGGMAAYGNNLAIMKNMGVTVTLIASADEILRRVSSSDEVRPLLADSNPKLKIISLLQKRAYYYISSHIIVSTDGKKPKEVAIEIKERLSL